MQFKKVYIKYISTICWTSRTHKYILFTSFKSYKRIKCLFIYNTANLKLFENVIQSSCMSICFISKENSIQNDFFFFFWK